MSSTRVGGACWVERRGSWRSGNSCTKPKGHFSASTIHWISPHSWLIWTTHMVEEFGRTIQYQVALNSTSDTPTSHLCRLPPWDEIMVHIGQMLVTYISDSFTPFRSGSAEIFFDLFHTLFIQCSIIYWTEVPMTPNAISLSTPRRFTTCVIQSQSRTRRFSLTLLACSKSFSSVYFC